MIIMSTSETRVVLEPHDWYVTHTVRLEGTTTWQPLTLRTTLRRNSYDHQSTAVVEVLRPDQGDYVWRVLHTLQPSEWVGDVPTVAGVGVQKWTAQDVEDAALIVVARMLGYCSRLLGVG